MDYKLFFYPMNIHNIEYRGYKTSAMDLARQRSSTYYPDFCYMLDLYFYKHNTLMTFYNNATYPVHFYQNCYAVSSNVYKINSKCHNMGDFILKKNNDEIINLIESSNHFSDKTNALKSFVLSHFDIKAHNYVLYRLFEPHVYDLIKT